MNALNLLMRNGSQSIATGINASIASMFLMPSGEYELPYIGVDIPLWAGYGLIGAFSASSVNLTGDFVFPLIAGNNSALDKIQMLSRPTSVGLLSLLVFYIMNSFQFPDYEDLVRVFLLTSGSYLVADYYLGILYRGNSGLQTINVNNPAQSVSVAKPLMPSAAPTFPANPTDFMNMIGLGGFY